MTAGSKWTRGQDAGMAILVGHSDGIVTVEKRRSGQAAEAADREKTEFLNQCVSRVAHPANGDFWPPPPLWATAI